MARAVEPKRRPGFWFRRIASAVVVLALFYWIAVLAAEVRMQIERLAVANSDNMQWTIAQTETEILSLQSAAIQANAGQTPNLREVRTRFDVLYSRINVLQQSPSYSSVRDTPDSAQFLDELLDFRERWVPIVDGPDEGLQAALPRLINDTDQARVSSRRIALLALSTFAGRSEMQRDSITDTLQRIAFLTVTLIALLFGAVAILLYLIRLRERQAAENRVSRERFETIISTALDAVIVTDQKGFILEYNGAAEGVFGFTKEEAIGKRIGNLIVPQELRDMHEKGMARFQKTGEKHIIGKGVVQLEALHKSGKLFPIDLTLASADAPDGEIYISFVRDISERVAAENELREARDRAVEGEKSKANLLAVMSHEIRTPLNGLLGTLDLMETEASNSIQQRYIRIMRNSGSVLLSHVNDVLDISRLDAGKMSINNERFDLISLVDEVMEGQAQKAQENGIDFRFSPPNPVLHEVYSDPVRLRQILINLVGNAIKFTRNGHVTVEAECQNGLHEVEIRVIDTGVGISEKDLTRIFGDFVTVDASYARSTTGTGLGLSISQRLATAMGGELGAESEPEDGSVFWLRLPMAPPKDAPLVSPPRQVEQMEEFVLPSLRILLTEDNAVNRLVAREMLERDGHFVTDAHNGQEAVALATGQGFDLVLMDISMPGMDGLEATRLIRSTGLDMATLPILATTAHAMPSEIQAFREAGMNDVLVKPISRTQLRMKMRALLSPEDQTDVQTSTPSQFIPLVSPSLVNELAEELTESQLHGSLRTFVNEVDAFLDNLRRQPCAMDRDQIAKEAHRLAGSSGVFGALKFNAHLRSLEEMASSDDLQGKQEHIADLNACWQSTLSAFDKFPALSMPYLAQRQERGEHSAD